MEAAQKAMEEAQKAAQKAARVSSGRSTSGSAASSGNSRSTQEKTGDEKENADVSVLGSLFGKNSESNSGAETSGAASSKTKAGATKTVKKNGSQEKSGKKTVSSKGTANQAAGSKSGAVASSYLVGESSSQKTPYAAALQDPKRQGQTKATEESRAPSMSDAQAAQWRAAASQASGNNEAAFRVVNSYLEQNENARRLWDLEAAAENSKAKTSARNAMTPEEMKTYRQMRALYDDYGTLWSMGYRAKEDASGLLKQVAGSFITLGEGAVQSVKDQMERSVSTEGRALQQAQEKLNNLVMSYRAYTYDENGVAHPTQEYLDAKAEVDAAEAALNEKVPETVLTPETSTGVRLYGEGSEHLSNAQLGLSGDAKFAMNTANAIAGNAPTMATALIPGVGPGISLGLSGAQAAGGRAAELSAQGESAGAALSRGLVSGGIEAATEILPVGSWVEIINNPAGKSALRSVLQQMGSEATEESVSYVANYLADKAAQDPTAQFSLEELAENAMMGGLTGGVYGGVGVGINRLRGGSANTQTQEQGATAELGLDDTVTSPEGSDTGAQPAGDGIHTPEQLRTIQEYQASTDPDLVQYYRDVKSGEKKAPYRVGTVNERAAQAMRDLTGIDTTGNAVVLDSNGVQHINNRHGGGSGSADATMSNELDVGRINYVLENFDDAYLSKSKSEGYVTAQGKRAPTVAFIKRVDGHYAVVEAVCDGKKNRNYIVTAYMTDNLSSKEFQKNIASRWQSPHNVADDSAAFGFTSETPAALSDAMGGIPALQNEENIASRWQAPHNATEQAATLGITSETPAAIGDAMSGSSATQSVAQAMNGVNELPALDDGAPAQYDGFNEGGGIYAGNPDLGRSVSQSSETGYPGGRGTRHQPGSAGTAADGTTGTAGRSSAQEVNYAQRAQAVTGHDRRSPYTRQLQSFYERLAAGEVDSTTMDQEVDQIARGLVREADYTVEADPGQQTLRNYLKNTRIYVDGKNAAEILNATGLKSISQYNIQNGLNLTTSSDGAVPLDTAMQELSGMSVGYAGDGISPVDDFMQIAARPERQVDSDLLQTNIDYTKEMILDQFTGRQTEDFESWLRTASESNEWGEAPDYIQHVAERYGVNAPAVPAESLGLDDSALAQPATDSGNLWDGTSGVMPEHSIGADMLRDYNRSEVPNLDPGTQRAASFGLVSPEDISGLGLGEQTHQLYSFREAGDNAVADFEVAVQQNAGDEIAASAQIMDELKSKNDWNADDFATMQEVEHRLQNQLNMTEHGSAEYNLVKERLKMAYESHSRASSRTGRALVQNRAAEFNEFTPVQKFQQVSDQIAKQYQADHVRESQKIDSLSKDIADVGKEAMGYQDAEFDEFLRENGIEPTSDSVTDHLEAARKIVRDLADAHGVSLTDDQVDHAAQRVVAGGDKDDVFNRLMADLAGISELQGQDFEDVIAIAEQMKEMPDSRERDALETKMYSIIAQNLPARTWFDKMNSFRYLAMLGNPRTHVRNVVGNMMMRGVINMKDGVAAVIQRAVLPEAQRTKSILTPADSDLVNAAKDYAENAAFSRVFRQADGDKFNIRSGIEGARKTFGDSTAGKALQKATDLNSRALQAEDEFFIKSEFANSLAQQMKAQGLGADALISTDSDMQNRISQMADRAIADAREATFQTDNWLAQKLSDFSKEAQQGSISQKLAYMVTEGILPFKRTPINIAKSALEYNPVGGLAEAVYRYKSGRSTDQVIDSVAKGLTGTTLIGAGYLLAQAGLLNGSGSDDEEENAFNEMQGQQQYAVNIPGVGSYTIDWASPAAIPLLIGAELSNASESENYSAGQVVDALRHMTQPVLETTMLSGLNDTFDEIRYLGDNEDALSAVASSAVGGYFGQFYPTVMGQMARTIDPYRRDSYGGGNSSTERDINYNVRALQNKTPGASMLNEPWIDAWGRPQENAGGNWFGRLVSNTLSPGYFSAENTTPVDEYLQDLYDATSDAGVLPERASSKVEGTYLTPEQKTEFASVRGQTAYDMIEELMNNSTFRGMSDEDQAATIRDIYSLANKVGAAAAIPDYTSDDSLYDVYLNGGVEGVVNYALADASLSNARADKQISTGDENAKLNSVETWDSMQSLGLDDEALVDTYLAKASDSTAERVNDLVGASGVVAYRDAYANADRDGNGDVTDNELRIALINSGLDDDLMFQTYMATQTTTNDAGETSTDDKAYSAYQTFGTSGGVNWMKYYSAYLVAKAQEQAAAKAAGESADLKGLAESLLNQMDLSVDERRAFFSMTDGRWTGNPY